MRNGVPVGESGPASILLSSPPFASLALGPGAADGEFHFLSCEGESRRISDGRRGCPRQGLILEPPRPSAPLSMPASFFSLFPSLSLSSSAEGVGGLWSGVAPSLVLVSNPIIQFIVYETLKQAAGNRHHRRHQMQLLRERRERELRDGGAGGASAVSPDDVGATRRRTASPGGPGSKTAAASVGGGEGTGTGTGTGSGTGSATGSGSKGSTGLPSHEAFLLGAVAKAVSTLTTYPLQLAQVKLRAGPSQSQVGGLRLAELGVRVCVDLFYLRIP